MRYYDRTALNPKGTMEDPKRCVVEVSSWGWHSFQCRNRRGKGPDGLYCGIHARVITNGGKPWIPEDK